MRELLVEMLDMLKRLEWAGERDSWEHFHVCPSCYSNQPKGHGNGCDLAALIVKAEQELK